MFCPKCGAQILDGENACKNCGYVVNQQVQQPVQPVQTVQPVQSIQQVQQNNVAVAGINILEMFKFLGLLIIKPIDTFDKYKDKMSDVKNGSIFGLIIVCLMTLINMLSTMISSVFVKSYDLKKSSYVTKIVFSNLKDIKWGTLIFKNFAIYACVILVVAFVFYVGSLIVKKDGLNFIKSIVIVAASVVPGFVGYMVFGPILAKIWTPLCVGIEIIGCIYTLVLITLLTDNELKINGNMRVYYYVACFAVLGIIAYYTVTKMISNTVSSSLNELDSLLDMYN